MTDAEITEARQRAREAVFTAEEHQANCDGQDDRYPCMGCANNEAALDAYVQLERACAVAELPCLNPMTTCWVDDPYGRGRTHPHRICETHEAVAERDQLVAALLGAETPAQ